MTAENVISWESKLGFDQCRGSGLIIWSLFTASTVLGIFLFANATWFRAVALCSVLAVTYIASLYFWRMNTVDVSRLSRDHVAIIKRRFISVAFASVFSFSMVALNRFMIGNYEHSLWECLGLKFTGSLQAICLPLLLTMLFFSGPLLLQMMDGLCLLYYEPRYWVSNFKNMIWLRNYVVAPVTEEFTFRACMIPILTPYTGVGWAIITCPFFFGVAHFHHLIESVRQGMDLPKALLSTTFQFSYTTVFGIYSAFLFARTGNFLAPCIVHTFCNRMGFPKITEVLAYKQPLQTLLAIVYISGPVVWYFLLFPLTRPDIYGNPIYWKD